MVLPISSHFKPFQLKQPKASALPSVPQDSLGQRPLHAAAKHGHAEAACRLVQQKAATW